MWTPNSPSTAERELHCTFVFTEMIESNEVSKWALIQHDHVLPNRGSWGHREARTGRTPREGRDLPVREHRDCRQASLLAS